MASFPSSLPDPEVHGLEEDYNKTAVRTEFEAGYVQSRARFTRARRTWSKIYWTGLSSSDLSTLLTFFNTYQGDSFTWTHPITSVEYTVRFSCDKVNYKYVAPEYYEVTISFEEV